MLKFNISKLVRKLIKSFVNSDSNEPANEIDSLHKLWHEKLRNSLNLDSDFTDGIDCDFEVLFEMWRMSRVDLVECFSNVQNSDNIIGEIQKFYNSKCSIVQEKAIIENRIEMAIENTISAMSKYVNVDILKKKQIRCFWGNQSELGDSFKYASLLTEELDDKTFYIIEEKLNMTEYAFSLFLSEPLYFISKTYEPVRYFVWKLLDEKIYKNPYEEIFLIYKNYNCHVVMNEHEIVACIDCNDDK